jgi:ribonuclease HII
MKNNILKSRYSENSIEVGCDEAGRGCLAGPVFASAVILPPDYFNDILNDSKQLSEKQRYKLREIIEKEALAWAVEMIDNETIDKINILNASILAMHKAIDKLKSEYNLLLIDGNRFKKYKNIPHKCIIKGDSLYLSIAAASVIAKTYRDDYMLSIHSEHPEYSWNKNKGYATKNHVDAIRKFGQSIYHRKTFHLKSDQLNLNF